jgi:hypothetical protein
MSEDYDRSAFDALQGLLKKKPAVPGERCDYCSTPLGREHAHVVDLRERRILCACQPCRIVFQPAGAAQGRYKVVPTRYREVENVRIDDACWDSLQIPIGLAFFFYNSLEQKVSAFYPGPAGATESLLPLEAWERLGKDHPVLATIEPDVEAVLIDRRARNAGPPGAGAVPEARCFIVPIDAAYELVGIMRVSWRGFDGGSEVHARVDAFFAKLRERCKGRETAPRS